MLEMEIDGKGGRVIPAARRWSRLALATPSPPRARTCSCWPISARR
ncbi:hypothetical protein ACRAWD_01140 [Caulobacter segnis]